MRKLVLFISCLLLTSGVLISCGDDSLPIKVTYKSAVDKVHSITYDQLEYKINDQDINESFVLIVEDRTCGCTATFLQYLESSYIPETHALFYGIDVSELNKHSEKFGINVNLTQPSACFFNKRVMAKQIDRGHHEQTFHPIDDGSGKLICNDFVKMMDSYTIQQDKLFLYDKYNNVIDDLKRKNRAIFYAFRSSCSDCKKASTSILFPYLNSITDINNKIYLLDLDRYRNNTDYQTIKDKLLLTSSSNPDYGYNDGVVPTFQYWENGQIKDASVFFNDVIAKKDGSFIVEDSFYSEERQNKLSYLNNVSTKVLKGMTLPANEVSSFEDEGQTYYFWNADDAIKYHGPLLNAFLTKYVI